MSNQDLIQNKNFKDTSVFTPANLLREARRQKKIKNCTVPEICILDPDGDILKYLQKNKQVKLNKCWACYHTELYNFTFNKTKFGIIACAVGGSFAVLLAEQLFVSGCSLLISVTSAGLLLPPPKNARYILIKEALRDEGTSYHYLPPKLKAEINPIILKKLFPALNEHFTQIEVGNSWTTDAPYRETKAAIEYARNLNANAVEMEAASLYAFAKASKKNVVCFAHLTNTMAQVKGDFEKGHENGSVDWLNIIYHTAKVLNKNVK